VTDCIFASLKTLTTISHGVTIATDPVQGHQLARTRACVRERDRERERVSFEPSFLMLK